MPGRSVVSVLLLLHGLLCLQQQLVAALGEMEMDDGGVMAEGSCMHFSVSPPPAPPEDAEERRDYYRAMAAKDLFRQQQLIAMMGNGSGGGGRRRQAKESSSSSSSKAPQVMSTTSAFELPMRSALNIAHVGMYLVSVRFGTPALPYNLVLDTANDLTWINCRLRRRKGKHYGRQSAAAKTMSVGGEDDVATALARRKQARKNWYRPAKSSSWRRIRCSEQQCAHLPYNTCQSPSKLESCSYYTKIQDGTVTIGIYGNEKATVAVSDGRMAKLPGLVLGCSVLEAGGSVDAHDGVLALGNGHISFAIHAVLRFGGRFSFCLLSANSSRDASSYLTFGPNPAVTMGPGTMETELLYNVDVKPAYGPRVTSVYVGGERLDIPDDVWNVDRGLGNGVILDTSTSVTALVEEAYDPLVAALDRHLAHLPRVTMLDFDHCYNWTFAGDGVDPAHNVTIPRLTVEMAGGARLEPGAKSVVMPEVWHGVACLAFRRLPSGGGPCIIGNVLMQEYIWEVDHNNAALRFKKDKCNTHHLHTSTGAEAVVTNPNNNNGTATTSSSSSSSGSHANATSTSSGGSNSSSSDAP